MPDRLTDIQGPSGASPERFDNNRTDPRARPTHEEPIPKSEPKPNPEYSRSDYSEGQEAADPGCKEKDENGNCYREGCPVHGAK